MKKLFLEVTGDEPSLRQMFEIIEKITPGIATPGSLSIEKAVIVGSNNRIVLAGEEYTGIGHSGIGGI